MFSEITPFEEACFDLKNHFLKVIFGSHLVLGTRKYAFKQMAERFATELGKELKLKPEHGYKFMFIPCAENQSGTMVIESCYFKVTISQDVNQPIYDISYNLSELDFKGSLMIDEIENLLDILHHFEIEEENDDIFVAQNRELLKIN